MPQARQLVFRLLNARITSGRGMRDYGYGR